MNLPTSNLTVLAKFLFLLLILLFASVSANAATLSSIDVMPSNPTINIGQSQAFMATGNYSDGSTEVLAASAKAISAGDNHTCALVSGGQVLCWGAGGSGQLGDGKSSVSASTPVMVSGISDATTIATGEVHSCALLDDGQVKCWGWNYDGQLGDGTTTDSSTPVTVSGLSGATAIVAGSRHTCALVSGGQVQCWGNNGAGQLGDETNSGPDVCGATQDPCSTTPVTVSGISGATAIAAGGSYTCALLGDGQVKCWGYNIMGQLGDGTTTNALTPVTVSGLSSAATAIAAGGAHTCAVLSDGQVQCWGDNLQGQLGDGTFSTSAPYGSPTPMTVSGLSGATAITAGKYHTCALVSSGQMQCWGYNIYGQLGDNTNSGPELCSEGAACSTIPVTVSALSGTTALTAGYGQTCAVISGGQVKCWGWNYYGQLGGGSMADSYTPVSVIGFSHGATVITAGNAHSCALVAGGQVQCWGGNDLGQLGDGTTNTVYTPVMVSGLSGATMVRATGVSNCALVAGGQVQCWGDNLLGELGIGSSSGPETCFYSLPCSTTPVMVSGISGATALATGGGVQYNNCALVAGGQVQCWGDNEFGQLGIGTSSGPELCSTDQVPCSTSPVTVSNLSGVVAIAIGSVHICALLSDGTVQCWGDNEVGQLGIEPNSSPEQCGMDLVPCSTNPVTVSEVSGAVAIAAGGNHTCALLGNGQVQCWGSNNAGQLGDGTTTFYSPPVMVSELSGAVAIAAGSNHTCALLGNGQVQCWGSNYWGQLGDGTTTFSSTPVTVSGLNGATAIAAGSSHNCALVSGGDIQCWGYNLDGGLGDGTRTNSSIPVTVDGLANVSWSSGDPFVATIDQSGLASALNTGTTTIAATFSSISGSTQLTVTDLPDLIMSKLFFGYSNITKKAGTNVMVTDTVSNIGTAKAGKFIVGYHLSTDMTYGNSDDIASASSRSVISLDAGASSAWPGTSVVIPKDTPTGVYHLCAKADDGDTVAEFNENNNWMCTKQTITVPKPDLVMKQVSIFSYTVTAGTDMVVLDSLANNGGSQALNFQVGYVLSHNRIIGDSDDIVLPTTRTIDALDVGAYSTTSTHVSIPVDVPAGKYWVGAIADINNAVDESNETNNARKASSQVTVNAP